MWQLETARPAPLGIDRRPVGQRTTHGCGELEAALSTAAKCHGAPVYVIVKPPRRAPFDGHPYLAIARLRSRSGPAHCAVSPVPAARARRFASRRRKAGSMRMLLVPACTRFSASPRKVEAATHGAARTRSSIRSAAPGIKKFPQELAIAAISRRPVRLVQVPWPVPRPVDRRAVCTGRLLEQSVSTGAARTVARSAALSCRTYINFRHHGSSPRPALEQVHAPDAAHSSSARSLGLCGWPTPSAAIRAAQHTVTGRRGCNGEQIG